MITYVNSQERGRVTSHSQPRIDRQSLPGFIANDCRESLPVVLFSHYRRYSLPGVRCPPGGLNDMRKEFEELEESSAGSLMLTISTLPGVVNRDIRQERARQNPNGWRGTEEQIEPRQMGRRQTDMCKGKKGRRQPFALILMPQPLTLKLLLYQTSQVYLQPHQVQQMPHQGTLMPLETVHQSISSMLLLTLHHSRNRVESNQC